MSRKRSGSQNPNQLKLVPGDPSDPPKEDFPRSMSVRKATKTGEQVLRLVQPLEPADEDRTDAWKDIGGGNRWAERVRDLKDQLQFNIITLDKDYDPLRQRDVPIYKLQQAMLVAKDTAGENDHLVRLYLLERANIAAGTNNKRALQLAGARDYDALGLLANAFKFTRGDDELKDQFMRYNCPSPMWQDDKLKELVLQSIDLTYRLLGEYGPVPQTGQKAGQSPPERFIEDLQDKYLATVIQYSKPPRHGTGRTQKANFENNIADLVKFAWKDWRNAAPSDKPYDEHSFKT